MHRPHQRPCASHTPRGMKTVGRTIRTFRDALEIEEERWKDFRRTLRPAKRELIDRVFEYARRSGDAGSMIVTPRITEVVFLSALMELLREIEELQRKIRVLEAGGSECSKRVLGACP